MLRLLGVEPGSVTPLGAVNAPIGSVHVIFDRSFRSPVPIAIHPMRNTATIAVPFDRLVDWLVAKGVDVRELSLPSRTFRLVGRSIEDVLQTEGRRRLDR